MILMTVINIFSFLVYISLAIYVLGKNPGALLNRVSSAVIGFFSLWSFCLIFIHNHYIPKNIAMLFIDICFISAAGFTSITLWFYLIFTEKRAILEKKIFYMMDFFFPLLFIYLQWNHRAILEDVLKVSYGWTIIWARSIWVYLFDFYFFLANAVTFYLLIDFRRKTKSAVKRKHTTIILTTKGIAFTLGSITDFILPQSGIHVIPLMADIFILIWVSGLVYAIARYKLFKVSLATAAENIISTMSDCLALLDPKGIIQLVNKACLNTLGYTENQLKGKPLITFFPSKHAQNEQIREMTRGKEFKNYYLTIKTKNGAKIPVSLSTSVMLDEEGNIAGVVWIARDISERMLAEELLKESEAKYSILVERARDGVAVVQDEVYRFVNKAMVEITGYSAEELLGRPLIDLVVPEARDMVAQRYRLRLTGEKVSPFYETKFQCKDGTVKNIELSAAVIQYNERPADMIVIRDITDRRRAEEEREKMQNQLLQSQKMEAVGLLAGGVAHDFNNILTVIQGYSNLAMMKVEETDPLFEDLKQVYTSAIQAARLTRQLLIFSRKQPSKLTSLDLNGTINNLFKMLLHIIGEDINITTILESNLCLIWADEGNIEQVIMNLSVNARDAMPNGGQLIIKTENVTLDEEQAGMTPEARPGQFVRLSVSDTGIGMSKEIIDRIFEPFFTTKGPGRGTGLGLAVIYGIVKQHKGWITVSSETGQGTTFVIYFPACFLRTEGEAEETFSQQELQGRGERILVVEDEEGVRKITTKVLQENGYLVSETTCASEALDVFEQEKGNFHLVISNVVLPDQTGLELVDRLLHSHPKLMVLLISGYASRKAQWSIINKRDLPFLQKPYTLIDLLRKVRAIIEMT